MKISKLGYHINITIERISKSKKYVVFSVEYRLAPETKCPDNVMDFYEALKVVT